MAIQRDFLSAFTTTTTASKRKLNGKMEATPDQAAEGKAIVRVLSAVLERLVGANTSLAKADPGQVTKFHALKAPRIGIYQYLERIHKYASCSTECFIMALIYIDRLIQRNNFLLTELNVHRVVITSVLLAAKFFDDAYYNNAYYAKVGGVLVSEMNSLEVEFLFRVNFSLHVSPDLYSKYHAELISHAIGSTAITGFMSAALNVPALPSGVLEKVTYPNYHVNNTRSVAQPYTAIPLSPESNDYSKFSQSDNCFIASAIPTQITPSPPQTASAGPLIASYTNDLIHNNHAHECAERQEVLEAVVGNGHHVNYDNRESLPYNNCTIHNAQYNNLCSDPAMTMQDNETCQPPIVSNYPVPGYVYQITPTNSLTMVDWRSAQAPVNHSKSHRLMDSNEHYNSFLTHTHRIPIHGNQVGQSVVYESDCSKNHSMAATAQQFYVCQPHTSVVAGCSGR